MRGQYGKFGIMVLFFLALLILMSTDYGFCEPAFRFETGKYAKREDKLDVEARFPKIIMNKPGKDVSAFNSVVASDMKMLMEQFVNDFKSAKKEGEIFNPWVFESEYDVKYCSDRMISVVVTIYQYSGGAHGTTDFYTYFYDVYGEQMFALPDLFIPDSAYLLDISDFCVEYLIGLGLDENDVSEGAGPDETNFTRFYVNNQQLVIIFPQYQVAPYAAGPQEAPIPWSYLEGDLKPGGPASLLE